MDAAPWPAALLMHITISSNPRCVFLMIFDRNDYLIHSRKAKTLSLALVSLNLTPNPLGLRQPVNLTFLLHVSVTASQIYLTLAPNITQ